MAGERTIRGFVEAGAQAQPFDAAVHDAITALPTNEERVFAQWATQCLLNVTSELSTARRLDPYAVGHVEEGVKRWLQDKQHGVTHSHAVYEGSKKLKEVHGDLYKDVTDDQLFARAVLHDLSEFLPRVNHNGKVVPTTPRQKERHNRLHPIAIAKVVSLFAPSLGISADEARSLAFDLQYHDYSYARPTEAETHAIQSLISDAGKLFIDADRFAATIHTQESNAVRQAIERNRGFSLGKWYMFRLDLSARDRKEWAVRTGGFYDGASALFAEFLGFSPMYATTPEGKRLVAQRQEQFAQEFIDYYKQEYRKGREIVENAWDHDRESVEIGVKIKNDAGEEGIEASPQDYVKAPGFDFNLALACITDEPVESKGEHKGRKYYGYSLWYDGEWYDPSILQFRSEEDLERAFREGIDAYNHAV